MKSPRFAAIVLAALLVSAAAAVAEPVTYKIDRGHSHVGFNVRHFFAKVPGEFTEFEGSLVYDDKNVAASTVEVLIQAASINTNHERRDGHLRSADFFAADSFKAITFKSTKVSAAGEGKLKVEGNLTIRDVTKPVTLDVNFLGSGPGSRGGQISGWEAATTINRKDFNVIWNRVLDHGGTMLGDNVAITIGIEAVTPPPAEAKK